MNETKHLAVKLGFVLCGTLAGALTGCTTYEGRPQGGGAYYEPSGQADASYVEIRTASDFYEPLSPYGRWEVVGSYGRCWIPGGVDADWGPYSNGYWQRTDAGWYWASDEPWGWATYHYGRWDLSPQFGWYWVPQTQWAPAWVSWRQGGGYVGWAPLGPSGRGVVTDNRRGAAPGGYVFVEERRFLDPVRLKTVIGNNTVITKTVVNQGPGLAVIEKASGRKMQAVPVRQLRSQEEAKVVARHPAPTATRERAVQMPVRSQAEKAPPAREPRQVEKPAIPTAEPQPPAARKEVHQTDEQSRVVKPAEQQRAPQEKARETKSENRQPAPAAVEARPETRPQANHEPQQPQPEAKHETKAEAERPAATREPAEQKAGKDDEKKDNGQGRGAAAS